MVEIQQLLEFDKELLLSMNGSSSLFMDGLMYTFSSTKVWIPLACALIYVLLRNNSLKNFFFILLAFALTIALCDQIASGLCKPLFQRFRPSRDPEIMYLVDVVNGYRGAKYGFMSSHASNTFGVFMFLTLLFKNLRLSIYLFTWALISGYSRIYLGVHYPGDVLAGSLVGLIVGLFVYWLYSLLSNKIKITKQRVSNLYTDSGYFLSDMNFLSMCILLTYSLIPIIGILVIVFNHL